MCLVCVDFQLGKLSTKEAKRNLSELMAWSSDQEKEHLNQVWEMVNDEDYKSAEESSKQEIDSVSGRSS